MNEVSLEYRPYIHFDAVIGWAWITFTEYDFTKNAQERIRGATALAEFVLHKIEQVTGDSALNLYHRSCLSILERQINKTPFAKQYLKSLAQVNLEGREKDEIINIINYCLVPSGSKKEELSQILSEHKIPKELRKKIINHFKIK